MEQVVELKTLFLGLFFSIGIFAVKSGIGLNYYISVQKRKKYKIAMILVFILIYLLVFSISFLFLSGVDILNYYDVLTGLLSSGMTLHFILAGLMILWGKGLLVGEKKNRNAKNWLILVLPCPVCMTVIFLSVAFFLGMMPGSGYGLVVAAWAGFIIMAFITGGLMRLLGGPDNNPEQLLGASMMMIAGYFMISVFIMPVFADAAKIYSIAGYEAEPGSAGWMKSVVFLGLILLMAVGGWRKRLRMTV